MKLGVLHIADRDQVVIISDDGLGYWLAEDIVGRPVMSVIDVMGEACIDLRGGGAALYHPLGNARFRPPLVPPRNVMCVGKNYRQHALEFNQSGFDSAQSTSAGVPDAPILFTKVPQAIIGPGDGIPYPEGVSDSVDYEAELAIIIGRQGRAIAREDALAHVFGYTIINDVTARDLQHKHEQWFLGKSLDGFCPMGPWITTSDGIDPANLDIRCWVNGALRQQASTADLIFDVPTIIATISAGMTLYPGDIIATGTPAGVGAGFTPPRFLSRGDEIVIEIDGLGRLVNAVV